MTFRRLFSYVPAVTVHPVNEAGKHTEQVVCRAFAGGIGPCAKYSGKRVAKVRKMCQTGQRNWLKRCDGWTEKKSF